MSKSQSNASLFDLGVANFATRMVVLSLCAGTLIPVHAAISSGERQILIDLYTSAGGNGWTQNTKWCSGACPISGSPTFNTSGTECTWYGISCDSADSHVVAIALADNKLSGTLPALGALTHLQYFNVASNVLSGSIPTLAGLAQLQTFYADDNQLSGTVPNLSGLTALTDFSVRYNQLNGSLPILSGLTNLYSFAVSGNQLTGNLPSLSGLSALQSFEVDANNLGGTIPSLSGLTNLLDLRLFHNRFAGSIPNLSGSPSLYHADFGNNQLTGVIPAAPSSLFSPLAFSPSVLCPNPLNTAPNANDPGWDAATDFTPWYATPYANNACDDIFTDSFEAQP